MAATYYLEVIDDAGQPVRRLRLDTLPCTVGRGKECDLPIAREQISRQHARFEDSAMGLTVEDLGSTNGTFVNLERITSPVPVMPGDRIHFGSHEFVLARGEPGGQTRAADTLSPSTSAGHTVMGFTAEPTGFPLQAPEFYELLNEEQLAVMSQPVIDGDQRVRALTLKAVSKHPELDAGHEELQHLAGQLGEEARLNQIIRRHCLAAASQAQLDGQPLLICAHPAELDDVDLLVDELSELGREHWRLELALEMSLTDADQAGLERLLAALHDLEIRPVLAGIEPTNPAHIELAASLKGWLVADIRHGADALRSLMDRQASGSAALIADRIEDKHGYETIRAIPGVWMRGRAAGEATPV